MTRKICALILLSLVVSSLGQTEPSTSSAAPEDPTSTTAAATTSSSSTTTTEPSTTSPSTTSSRPTTSRAPETTTSASTTPRPTTTSTSTTTSKPPDTTTSRPSTTSPTTTSPSTTTLPPVAPTPPAFPENKGEWSVKGPSATSPCILMHGALQLNAHVNSTGNNPELLSIDVPSGTADHVSVSGRCKADEQTLRINWWSTTTTPDHSKRNNTVIIKFGIQADDHYAITSIKYTYAHNKHVEIVGPFFLTSLKHSYICKANQHLQTDNETSYVLTENLQFEAFREENQDPKEVKFSSADECKADNRKSTGVVLGIAVGIGLLIVIVISLGIYIFKRCRRGGYQPLDTYS